MALQRKGVWRVALMVWVSILTSFAVARAEVPQGTQDTAATNHQCLRCHGMATLGYQDPKTRALVLLAVDAGKFAASDHARMACTTCHQGDYAGFPHHADHAGSSRDTKNRQNPPKCLGCHGPGAERGFKATDFQQIGQQFRLSVHYKALPRLFDCSTCHDPHVSRAGNTHDDSLPKIEADNAICRSCHDSEPRFAALTSGTKFQSLSQLHQWLPTAELHWRNVRCVECHTPHGAVRSHEIVRGDAVERNCVACHSKSSLMLSRLYQHRARE
ncbi:MAG: hypothetical protein HQL37_10525, partial [Alphaproteobacteria bacterium]|nr:hypothetical protein [Alphaproteobacteria bacterium]